MSWGNVMQYAPWGVLGGLVLWYLKDRRKDRAAGEVAERTVAADVTVKDVGALEARVLFAERAFDAERVSYERRIDDLQTDNDRLRAENEHKDQVIERLRQEIADAREQIVQLSRRLTAMSEQLDELSGSDTTTRQEAP